MFFISGFCGVHLLVCLIGLLSVIFFRIRVCPHNHPYRRIHVLGRICRYSDWVAPLCCFHFHSLTYFSSPDFVGFTYWCDWSFWFVLKFPLCSVSIKDFNLWHFWYVSRLFSKCVPFQLVLSKSLLAVFGRVIFRGVSVSSWHFFPLLVCYFHLLASLVDLCWVFYFRN